MYKKGSKNIGIKNENKKTENPQAMSTKRSFLMNEENRSRRPSPMRRGSSRETSVTITKFIEKGSFRGERRKR